MSVEKLAALLAPVSGADMRDVSLAITPVDMFRLVACLWSAFGRARAARGRYTHLLL